jgi:hypothetical protein
MRAQLNESMGLRSTRTTARQREVPEAGTSNVSDPESLRKTHLTCGQPGTTPAALQSVYSRVGRRFTRFRDLQFRERHAGIPATSPWRSLYPFIELAGSQ